MALVFVAGAGVAGLLATPHAAVSREIPMPTIDRTHNLSARVQTLELAQQAEQGGLPYAVRAVGEALRRYGAARAHGVSEAAEWSKHNLQRAVQQAVDQGFEAQLHLLQALQTAMFLRATAQYSVARGASQELQELGGELLSDAAQSGWLDASGFRASDAELRAWFWIRWGLLTGLSQKHPFAPTLDDWRTYYFFLLRPEHRPAQTSWADVLAYRIHVVTALAGHDTAYPSHLALGILKAQLGDYSSAADELRAFLQGSPNGPWALRAVNTLKAVSSVRHSRKGR